MAGVQFHFPYDELEEPWPRVRYAIALALATTVRHRRWRWPLVVASAFVGAVAGILGGAAPEKEAGPAGATMLALLAGGIAVTLAWRASRRTLARQVLLVEEEVEPGLEYLAMV